MNFRLERDTDAYHGYTLIKIAAFSVVLNLDWVERYFEIVKEQFGEWQGVSLSEVTGSKKVSMCFILVTHGRPNNGMGFGEVNKRLDIADEKIREEQLKRNLSPTSCISDIWLKGGGHE